MRAPFKYEIDINRISPEVHLSSYHDDTPGILVHPRIIHDFEFVYVVSGRGRFHILDETLDFGPDDCIVTPPYALHSYEPLGETTGYFYLHLSVSPGFEKKYAAYRGLTKGYSDLKITTSTGDSIPVLIHGMPSEAAPLLRAITGEYDSLMHTAASYLKLKQLVLRFLSMIIGASAGGGKPGEIFRKSEAFIHKNFRSRISIADLAGMECVSKEYYSMLFKAAYGCSPMVYIIKKRLNYAKQLMMNSDAAIKEIAYECGFADPYYFSRLFKKYECITPVNYRRYL